MAAVTSCGYSLTGPSSFCRVVVINENEVTSWGKSLYQPALMHVIT